MTQQNFDQRENDPKNEKQQDANSAPTGAPSSGGDESAGSQAETTGYGTGQSSGQGTAPTKEKVEETPSNAGDAGFRGTEGTPAPDGRLHQMSHADGSSREDDPRV